MSVNSTKGQYLGRPAKDLWREGVCEQKEYGSSDAESIIVARFETKEDEFTKILVKHSNPDFQNIPDGKTVYLNSIFLIKYYDDIQFNPEYTTLSGIRNAKPWANKTYFRNYYDVDLEYKGSFPITVKFQDEAGKKIQDPVNIISKYGPKEADGYKEGMWPAWNYSKSMTKDGNGILLPAEISSGGKTYMLKCSYITRTAVPVTKDCSEETAGPEWVRFAQTIERNPAVYVGGTDVVAVYTDSPDCNCFTSATIPSKEEIEGEIPADHTVIGQKVTMQVDLQQSPESVENWKKWIKNKKDFEIRIRLWRSDNDKIDGISNTGAGPKWSAKSGLLGDTGSGTVNKVSAEELLAYLNGGSKSKILFEDDLTGYPIPEGGTISFRYNADVFISANDSSGKVIEIGCSRPKESVWITWTRPFMEVPDVGNFTSTPKMFSEIKEGSPQASGTSANETFDAMSGTPTTRSLYFAAGGSEFIVDIQVEYVPQVTQTRTYRSYFTPVVNGWAMSPIDGAKSDPAPPAPTPRTVTDACAAPSTEKVTQTSEPYVKEPASGTPGEPGYKPAVMGTKFGWYQSGHPSTTVGGYEDTWTQTVTFDYMKINKAAVWKIERSKVDGMATLVGTEEVTASITQGDPGYFMNIASNNTSADGRLRYSLETNQHDNVVWFEGPSDNCLSNSKTGGPVNEQKKFEERRKLTTNVTAVSDFLILQTSSGDQSVMYFQKTSNTAKVTDQLDVPTSDFDEMWTNNPLSAANWDEKETIKVGSYKGTYGSPATKYSGAGGGTVSTVFDSMPAGLNRPARPSAALRLQAVGLDVPDTLRNGEYMTGSADVFYKLMFKPYNPNNLPIKYNTSVDSRFGMPGQAFPAPYSPLHQKVNDVVIHNPVSVQHATVISLPNSLDQRIPASKALGGNKQEAVAEYERVLDPNYRQNVISNPDAEIVNADGTVAGWNTWVAAGSSSEIVFTHRTGDQWVIGPGTKSFEVNSAAGSGTQGGYWKDIPIKPNVDYRFEGDISCHRCEGYFELQFYTADRSPIGSGTGAGDTVTGGVQRKTLNLKSPSNASYLRIHMMKGKNVDAVSNTRDYLFVDNLSLKNMTNQEFVAIEPVQVTQEVPNPDYVEASPGTSEVFHYTGGQQTFTASRAGTYTLELWGAAGGSGSEAAANRGGYAKGDITLSAGETLYLYVGGKGGDRTGGIDGCDCLNQNGGWNGGGSGVGSAGPGGGGGGGSRDNTGIQTYGGAEASTSTLFQGQSGDTARHSSSYPNDEGGGGGYYGGQVIHGDDPRASWGGTSWTGNLANAQMIPGNSLMPSPSGGTQTGQAGNGVIRIVSPPRPESGSPTKIVTTTAGGSDTSPPSDAYILKPISVDPNAGAGGYTPGNFILLDYGFQLYFPNTGDFFGNGQWGWSQTTSLRGKGFVDGMDTTEWTRAKYVKFAFHVIYNNTLYKAHEWIELPLNSPSGDWIYDFYVPLANREKISALVEWKSIAINAPFEDNDTPVNKARYDAPRKHAAKHSALKRFNVDIVGRIGNMVIEDTGDFRFSNLFKQSLVPTQWLVPNVVKRVNQNAQHRIVGDTTDIRGYAVSAGTRYLNTWGMLSHLEQTPVSFPLSPEKNNIPALRNQPMRIGYEIFSDIQTIGNYYSNMQITPYYYHLNLQNGDITPVDLYMHVNREYKLINKHGGVFPGWNPASVYEHPVALNWDEQAGRRNVTVDERDQTTRIAGLFAESGGDTAEGKAAEPYGNYIYGNAQFLQLTGRNRTFIGRDETYGQDKNPGNKLSMLSYTMQAQRWHYSYRLPSSAVAVKSGQPATQANINALRTNTGVILMAADIKAVGDTYTLQYSGGRNGTLPIAGTNWPLTEIPYPVVAVYSANKSSADDLDISGTH